MMYVLATYDNNVSIKEYEYEINKIPISSRFIFKYHVHIYFVLINISPILTVFFSFHDSSSFSF